jgi:hypothetical protein
MDLIFERIHMRLFLIFLPIVCLLPLLAGCNESTATADYTDVAAADMALATMVEPAMPQPLPPPDNGDTGSIGRVGGPVDTIRDAKALIAKANKAVDRGTAILDAVERDGKVSVDIKLPKPLPKSKAVRTRIVRQRVCDGTSCHYEDVEVPIEDDEPTPFDEPNEEEATTQAAGACNSSGNYSTFRRRGLFWRWR